MLDMFITSLKNIRKHIREKRRMDGMKLGVTYSLFNGEEMLCGSITAIRDQVDYINVVYQTHSWFGVEANPDMVLMLNKLKKDGFLDNIIEYKFDDFDNNSDLDFYTLDKKNIGVEDLKKHHCTHCMIMDADEYYKIEELKSAKEYILLNNITCSCCSIYDYHFSPCCRNRDVNKYAVPFIFKLRRYSRLSQHHHMPCLVDPLRTFPYIKWFDKFHYFSTVTMHHMTGIRKDYNKKLQASISNATEQGRKHISDTKTRYGSQKEMSTEELLRVKNELGGYIAVENIFNIE